MAESGSRRDSLHGLQIRRRYLDNAVVYGFPNQLFIPRILSSSAVERSAVNRLVVGSDLHQEPDSFIVWRGRQRQTYGIRTPWVRAGAKRRPAEPIQTSGAETALSSGEARQRQSSGFEPLRVRAGAKRRPAKQIRPQEPDSFIVGEARQRQSFGIRTLGSSRSEAETGEANPTSGAML